MANKTYQSKMRSSLRTTVITTASCLVLSGIPLAVQAAGLGKVVVFSALGQPLRAEIGVTATREELADMKAQLASPETFKQAGLDYATTLLSIRFNLEKRPNGQAVIKLSSDKPINDPFVDILLELNWSSGRLVREYTFLLDPPEYVGKSGEPVSSAKVSKVPAPVVSASQAPKSSAPAAGSSLIDNDVRARAIAQIGGGQPAPQQKASSQPSPKKPMEQPQAAVAGEGREVKGGDTLHKIATDVKPDGVSLDQMLVALFRANPDAFEGGNMNRLRAGKILTIPEKQVVESVTPAEARKVISAQSSDWSGYRSKLAGAAAAAPVKEDAGKQESAGRITAKVDDKEEQAAPKDQLKLSRTQSQSSSKKRGAVGGSDEDSVAKDKALKEANDRVAALEKNVADLQKLLELRNKNLAELQKQAAAKPEQPVAPPKPAEPPKPVESVKPAEPPKPVEPPKPAEPKPVEPPKPTEPTKSPEVPPVVETPPAPDASAKMEPPAPPVSEKVAEPAAQPEPKPVVKPKKVAPPPPPPEEPGFFDGLLDSPLALAGGGAGILALIGGLIFARRRRASAQAPEQDMTSTLSAESTTSLTANSVFRSTGGQSVDTSSQTPAQTDFSQAGPGSIDTDEVDPVAEADVYMAYGRDAQAEEILLEAKQKDPRRLAIHLKLLEIYSGRKDVKQFETIATDLYGETGGVGSDWDKAAAMGRVLDPGNPIFRGGSVAAAGNAATVAAAVNVPSPAPFEQPAVAVEETADLASLDFDLGEPESKTAIAPEAPKAPAVASREPAPLDFDLPGISLPEEKKTPPVEVALPPVEQPHLDFDIGTSAEPVVEEVAPPEVNEGVPSLDFDLGAISLAPAEEKAPLSVVEAGMVSEEPLSAGDSVEFDVSLTESTFLGRSVPEPSGFDLSAIDLDLQSPELEIPSSVPATEAGSTKGGGSAEPSSDLSFESVQVSTAVNPDFASEQMETLITPGMGSGATDTMVNPDFAIEQAETIVSPSLGSEAELAPELEVSVNEEVATKLDLAKAYEEMGDLEGARELLQEVMKEGDVTQRESAKNLLSKIGG